MDTKKIITNNQQLLSNQQKNNIALFLAILFHVCGLIGIIYTPYKEWFIRNTPINLLLMAALLLFTQKEKNISFFLFVLLCYATGMITEIIGINTGYLFGNYEYGEVLGPKLYGVPWLIGINWFIAVFCSGNIVFRLNEWLYKKLATDMRPSLVVQLFSFVIDAALLTTLFDYILEPLAVKLGYWKWLPDNSIPIYNFVCWFIINSALLTVFRLLKFNKHNQFAVHLLIIQVLFFLALQTFL
ncbi:MAG TPA: carotenoid biosynthesis protein [Chitinophagaceae bacterium]|nr:carotenoid biosynthesis protein [Chitinophagaceae bacterium]